MEPLSTIEICKEDLKFSAAHFTIFSATHRERLHGHNFRVKLKVTAPVGADGLSLNYAEIKQRIRTLCGELDEYTILPAASPHLRVSEENDCYTVEFNGEQLRFLKSDTLVLPIRNTTVEEFAGYLLARLREDAGFLAQNRVARLEVGVSSGAGQWGTCEWTAQP